MICKQQQHKPIFLAVSVGSDMEYSLECYKLWFAERNGKDCSKASRKQADVWKLLSLPDGACLNQLACQAHSSFPVDLSYQIRDAFLEPVVDRNL